METENTSDAEPEESEEAAEAEAEDDGEDDEESDEDDESEEDGDVEVLHSTNEKDAGEATFDVDAETEAVAQEG